MKRASTTLFFALTFFAIFFLVIAATPLPAQVAVQAGKQVQVLVLYSTSVVSLDAHIAEATMSGAAIFVSGVNPGDTRLIVIGPSGLMEIPVHVYLGPPVFPPGFVPPTVEGSEGGSYEFRYSSDRREFDNTLDLRSQSGNRIRQLHFTSATAAPGGQAVSYLPSAYYRFADGHFDATLLDQNVCNSPLTLDGVVLRGLHVTDGGFQFHAGYTASALFHDVFLPAEKEIAAGISYQIKLGRIFRIMPNLYLLDSPYAVTPQDRIGVVRSVVIDAHLPHDWHVQNEFAWSRGSAFASEVTHEHGASVLHARVRQRAPKFPALRANNLPGLQGDFSWIQPLSENFTLQSGGNISRIELGTIRENTSNAYSNLRYKLQRGWSLGTGATYGSFAGLNAGSSKSLSLQEQINLDRQHFGAGLQYQFSTASQSFSHGQGLRETIRLGGKHLQIGEFVDWQTQALSIDALVSQVPGLQQELSRLGIAAVTPEQLAALLQDATFLASLGLSSGITIQTVPSRLQWGGDLAWDFGGVRANRMNLYFIQNHNQFAASSTNDSSLIASYIRDFSAQNQIQASLSWLHTSFLASKQPAPVFSISLRHTFSHTPGAFSAEKHGSIAGVVFLDPRRQGIHETGMEPVVDATVVLDFHRSVATDRAGRYHFDGLSEGKHHVELKFDSPRRHFFTTPKEDFASAGEAVDFGIAFSTLELSGRVEDDAGGGLENVSVEVFGPDKLGPDKPGPEKTLRLTTDISGKFLLDNVSPGTYRVQVVPESAPIGYITENLIPAQAEIAADFSEHPVLKIPAMRILTGTLSRYDASAGSYLPVSGAEIQIAQLQRHATTNSAGKFTLGELPPGPIEVTVTTGASSLTHTVIFPTRPTTIQDDLHISSLTGEVVYHLAGGGQ